MALDFSRIPLPEPAPAPWIFDGQTLRDANGKIIGDISTWSEQDIWHVVEQVNRGIKTGGNP